MRMVEVRKGGWSAETRFCCLEDFPAVPAAAPAKGFALIEAKPITGRTHQIRVHLAGLKLPIAGDFLYGGKCAQVPRLMLHAKSLQLQHPISGQMLTEALCFQDFSSVLQNLKNSNQ